MSATNTTTPEVPAWIDLDGFCRPELREAMARTADALDQVLAEGTFERELRTTYELLRTYENELPPDLPDDFASRGGLGGELSGFDRMMGMAYRIANVASAATGHGRVFNDAPVPEWYEGDD